MLTDPGQVWIYKNKDAYEEDPKRWLGCVTVGHVDAAINPSMMRRELKGEDESSEDVGMYFFSVHGAYQRKGIDTQEEAVMYMAADHESEKVNWLVGLSAFIQKPGRKTSTY